MSSKKDRSKGLFYFTGFVCPTTTPVPDQLFDILLPVLKEAELKVLLYIIRRTFGFKKNSDAISLNQISNGIKTKGGKILDYGTGLDRRSVMRACKGLLEKNIIKLKKGVNEDGVNQINIYSLNIIEPRVGENYPYSSDQNVPTEEENFPYRGDLKNPTLEENFPAQQTDKQINSLQQTDKQQDKEDLVALLIKIGISKKVAERLHNIYPTEIIMKQIKYLPFRRAENPPALLIKALNEDWPAPAEYLKQQAKQEIQKQKIKEVEKLRIEKEKIQHLKNSLSAEKIEELKTKALQLCLEESGNLFNSKDIPDIIINAYLNEIIKKEF